MNHSTAYNRFDVLVIGAGVIGLSVASEVAKLCPRVGVIERHAGPGRETSTRNSGVIHAGLYYPKGSAKTKLCIEGRERLYRWCAEQRIPHRQCGKLVVATSKDETAALERLLKHSRENGVEELRWIDKSDLKSREPNLNAWSAIWSPRSGVLDADALVQSLRRKAEEAGVAIGWQTELVGVDRAQNEWKLRVARQADEEDILHAPVIINASGLYADKVARWAGFDTRALGWEQRWVRGDYYSLSASAPTPNCPLVYPLPHRGLKGLGIHLTQDLGGQWRAGPDTTDIEELNYEIGENKADAFAASLARWLPGISASQLRPDYAGIRPKLALRDPAHISDFILSMQPNGFMHLGGIESPGLTASLAIGVEVARVFIDMGFSS